MLVTHHSEEIHKRLGNSYDLSNASFLTDDANRVTHFLDLSIDARQEAEMQFFLAQIGLLEGMMRGFIALMNV